MEETLKITQFQPPCDGQGHLPLYRVAPSLVQPGLEHFMYMNAHVHAVYIFSFHAILFKQDLISLTHVSLLQTDKS